MGIIIIIIPILQKTQITNQFKELGSPKYKKGKSIPVTSREGPQGCETSRLPHFL
jgi:hypothetical protein